MDVLEHNSETWGSWTPKCLCTTVSFDIFEEVRGVRGVVVEIVDLKDVCSEGLRNGRGERNRAIYTVTKIWLGLPGKTPYAQH